MTITTLSMLSSSTIAGELCDDLRKVMSSDISSLVGNKTEEGRWKAVKELNGFPNCEVWKTNKGDLSYSCRGPVISSEISARAKFRELKSAVGDCVKYTGPQLGGADSYFFSNDKMYGGVNISKSFSLEAGTNNVKDDWYLLIMLSQQKATP